MRRSILLILAFLVTASPSFCVKIDGKFWDWEKIRVFQVCKPRHLARDRAGFDMEFVKMSLGKNHLYMYIEGTSVTGLKQDSGEGVKKTSIRVSFNSAQSPLNRVRIAAETRSLWEIKISRPGMISKVFGSKKDKYWMRGKFGKMYAYELKIPVFYSSKGIHAAAAGGPLIELAEKPSMNRDSLSNVLINCVDMKTHRLVDTVQFTIRKGEL